MKTTLQENIVEALKNHNVKTFHIDEDSQTQTVTYRTDPIASKDLQEDIRMRTPAYWKVNFDVLPENWNVPMTREQFTNPPKFVPPPKRAMTKEDYMLFHEACCRKMVEITKAKNSDYTGESSDPFANFQQIGTLVQLPNVVEIGFLTRMSDKISRIGSFLTKGSLLVKDESVEDTLLDLANYCILFAGYLRSKRGI